MDVPIDTPDGTTAHPPLATDAPAPVMPESHMVLPQLAAQPTPMAHTTSGLPPPEMWPMHSEHDVPGAIWAGHADTPLHGHHDDADELVVAAPVTAAAIDHDGDEDDGNEGTAVPEGDQHEQGQEQAEGLEDEEDEDGAEEEDDKPFVLRKTSRTIRKAKTLYDEDEVEHKPKRARKPRTMMTPASAAKVTKRMLKAAAAQASQSQSSASRMIKMKLSSHAAQLPQGFSPSDMLQATESANGSPQRKIPVVLEEAYIGGMPFAPMHLEAMTPTPPAKRKPGRPRKQPLQQQPLTQALTEPVSFVGRGTNTMVPNNLLGMPLSMELLPRMPSGDIKSDGSSVVSGYTLAPTSTVAEELMDTEGTVDEDARGNLGADVDDSDETNQDKSEGSGPESPQVLPRRRGRPPLSSYPMINPFTLIKRRRRRIIPTQTGPIATAGGLPVPPVTPAPAISANTASVAVDLAAQNNLNKMDKADLALTAYLELPQFNAKEMLHMATYLEKADANQPASTANIVRRIKVSAIQAKADERRRAMETMSDDGSSSVEDNSIFADLRAVRATEQPATAVPPLPSLVTEEDDPFKTGPSSADRKRRARPPLGSMGKLSSRRMNLNGSQAGDNPASPSNSTDELVCSPMANATAISGQPPGMTTATDDKDKPKHVNHDYCDSCNGTGELICCDACPLSFHYLCTDPPLDPDHLPEGDWHCIKCQMQRNKPTLQTNGRNRNETGSLLRLMDLSTISNPVTFTLPLALQEYFEGVTSEPISGMYTDSAMRRKVTPMDVYVQSSTDRDNWKCHACGKLADPNISIECSFCPLVWHYDCLEPPMTHAPPQSQKWACPIHVENILPRKRLRRFSLTALGTFILKPQLPPGSVAAIATSNAIAIDGAVEPLDGVLIERASQTSESAAVVARPRLSANGMELASSAIPTDAARIAVEFDQGRPAGPHVLSEHSVKIDFVRSVQKRLHDEESGGLSRVAVPDDVVSMYNFARTPIRADDRDIKDFLQGLLAFQEQVATSAYNDRLENRANVLSSLICKDTTMSRQLHMLSPKDLRHLAKGRSMSEIGTALLKDNPVTAELLVAQPMLLRFAAWSLYQDKKHQAATVAIPAM